MRQRSFLNFLTASIMVLLLIFTAGCNNFAGKNTLNSVVGENNSEQPLSAIFVSQQAPVMLSMLLNKERLQSLKRDGELSPIKESLFASTDIDFRKDIEPWLGDEITLAVMTADLDNDTQNGKQPGYLMVLTTDNPEKSREFVEILFSRRVLAGTNLKVKRYQGVKLIYDELQEDSPNSNSNSNLSNKNSQAEIKSNLAAAVVGDRFVLFANTPKVLRQAINNVQAPNINLSSSRQYRKALQELPKEKAAVAFLNLPQIVNWQGLQLKHLTYGSQIVSLKLNPQQLLAETNLLATKETLPPLSQLSQPVAALKYIPQTAGLAISGSDLSHLSNSNLAQFWQQTQMVISPLEEDTGGSQLIQPLQNLTKPWGLNLSKDIFDWVEGEFAYCLLPSEQQADPEWVFVVEKSESTHKGIARLDEIARANNLSISPFILGKQKIYAWTQLTANTESSNDPKQQNFAIDTKVRGVHTSVGNYEIFASSVKTINKALAAQENSLIDNSDFKDSITQIPQSNQGYVYIDWTKSREILERQLPILRLAEIVGKPFFQKLHSLTISTYGKDKEILKSRVIFQLDAS